MNSIHHHLDDSTLLSYGAGALNEGFSFVVATHLQMCEQCRERQAQAEAIGGELLASLPPVQMAAGGLNALWAKIDNSAAQPQAISKPKINPQALLDGDYSDIRWRTLVPGIKQHIFDDLESDSGSVRLFSIAPGTTIPHHSHGGGELTLILSGSYHDEIGRFQRGDIADLDDAISHQPIADTAEPCVCLIATDQKLRFSGVINRVLQPLIGI